MAPVTAGVITATPVAAIVVAIAEADLRHRIERVEQGGIASGEFVGMRFGLYAEAQHQKKRGTKNRSIGETVWRFGHDALLQ
jgi:hypothetical protein